jgi:hypothetical protein
LEAFGYLDGEHVEKELLGFLVGFLEIGSELHQLSASVLELELESVRSTARDVKEADPAARDSRGSEQADPRGVVAIERFDPSRWFDHEEEKLPSDVDRGSENGHDQHGRSLLPREN